MGNSVGAMDIPPDFKYLDVFLLGKPRHERFDRFSVKHPKMNLGKRAKIFAPFDALRGFNEAISSKTVAYEPKRELSREAEKSLNRSLEALHGLTFNSRMARQNRITVTVTFFVPCTDPNSFAFGFCGQYHSITGICQRVDPDVAQTIRVADQVIAFGDIWEIECCSPLFKQACVWEDLSYGEDTL
jgi:hypothetical protein